ncbi:hypothetical protein CMO96_00755 [Candidatus Woesebacteria bacterium]|nr:hypothetical protein [Candidatus Woesebacteria bacterium]
MKHKIFIELAYIAIIIYAIWYISDIQHRLSVAHGALIEQREMLKTQQDTIIKQKLLIDALEKYIIFSENGQVPLYIDKGKSPIYNEPL